MFRDSLAAEFLGNFWRHILDVDSIKATLQFVCAELMENAVYHSVKSEYMIVIQLCFKTDELMVCVKNSARTEHMEEFKKFAGIVLAAKDLQKLLHPADEGGETNRQQKIPSRSHYPDQGSGGQAFMEI